MNESAINGINKDSIFELNQKYSTLNELLSDYRRELKVDLGCGYYKPDGYIGVDNGIGFISQIENDKNQPDIFMDITASPLPFKNNSCDEVRASHILEHIDALPVMEEVHRLLKPQTGLFRIILPYANSAEGLYPGHTVFFTEKWFQENIWFNDRFEIKNEYYYKSAIWKKVPKLIKILLPFDVARQVLFNVCHQMELHCYPKK